ncbi:TonB-dependent receptor [Pseudoalteromonas luteoviolacea]|uniref:TonB-dependent receptor n=1 Tax=Pseudoalteromonas luteoviolacea TaxID=43657 RepID=UPI001B38502D|nr:TonB-dependent receptor [Pseudoalteromonas luteoviolacea]MBQ4836570.1 TonB-dependent receptor [Pseudoalteromonas luteoviolacea]
MKQVQFVSSRVALCVALALSGKAYASEQSAVNLTAEEQNSEIEVIEIRGIKGSLTRAMNLKRNASGVVDAISAEEMGKFPDTNLAESLQRITGVAVSRSNGEGSQITVRGFGPDFNLITLNGRQMPGTGNSRSYDLENLSADGVMALEVFKTARAENPSGGLGATVNIVTRKPLASPGERYTFSAKAIHDSSNVENDDITPELSALYSNTFIDDAFGVSFSLTHHERDFQKQQAHIQGWQANVDLPGNIDDSNVIDPRPLDSEGNRIGDYFFPRDMNYGIEDLERDRTNGHIVFQYAPTDDLVLSVDYTHTKAVIGKNGIGWGMWNEYGGNINAYELDENGTAVFADISGNDGSFTASRSTTEVIEKSAGINIDWHINDVWRVSLDYHDSSSETDNGIDKGIGSEGSLVLGSDQLRTKNYDYRTGDIPHAQIHWLNGSTTLLESEIDSHFSQFVHSPGKAEVQQLQIDATWENDRFDIPLNDVKFGFAMTDQTMGGSNAWSGLIGGFLFNPAWPQMFPDSMFVRNNTNGFLDAFASGGANLNPNYYYTFDFDEVVARSEAFLTNEVLGGDDYFATTAYHDLGTFSQSSVQEETVSFYVQSAWEFEVASLPVYLNLGIRYEETDVTSVDAQPIPVSVWWLGGSEWHTQYLPEDNSQYTSEGQHDVLLPMIDVKVDFTDELVGRVSWGKTITRAPLGDLAGGRVLSGSPKIGSRNGSEGNTNLEPFESTNLDLSLEYYYDESSYAAIGYFKKSVKNFIGSQVNETTIDGFKDIYQGPRWNQAVADIEARGEQATSDAIFLQMQANGATLNSQGYIEPSDDDPLLLWKITKPFNATDTKKVDGFEIAFQHVFGESGFGIGLNATFVDGDVEFDVNSLDQQTPLTGLSDSANAQFFYEKDGLSIKVTYAWRDEYLIGVGQDQGSADNPPQFAKAYAQLDASVNYDIDERWTVFLEGINLNDETEQGFGRYERQFLFARQYGPRYTLGVRYSFQ